MFAFWEISTPRCLSYLTYQRYQDTGCHHRLPTVRVFKAKLRRCVFSRGREILLVVGNASSGRLREGTNGCEIRRRGLGARETSVHDEFQILIVCLNICFLIFTHIHAHVCECVWERETVNRLINTTHMQIHMYKRLCIYRKLSISSYLWSL